MANKHIADLPAVGAIAQDDRMLVSTSSGGLTRLATVGSLPFSSNRSGAVSRTAMDKLREQVSVKDFGAVGDGIADDTGAFVAALASGASAIHVPDGIYKLTTPLDVPAGIAILGHGRDTTVLKGTGARLLDFKRTATGALDWNRGGLARCTIEMAQGGIVVRGHEWFCDEVKFRGGAAGLWCIELENANECALTRISAGLGGGVDDLVANGIHWFGTSAFPTVNFGDGLLNEIALKGKTANWVGIKFEHAGSTTAFLNNVLFNRVQITCPQTGLTPYAGSLGLSLSQCRRMWLSQVDIEVVETAIEEIGSTAAGQTGASSLLSYAGVHALNCPTPYRDSNATNAGTNLRRLFMGTTGVFPVKTGIGSTDPSFRAGEGDTLLPAGLWLAEPNQGGLGVQLRANAQGVLVVAQDFFDNTSPARDGNSKNARPRRGLVIDASANDTTKIQSPRGVTTSTSRRLEIGNGPAHADGELRYVALLDPLMLEPRTTQPTNPRDGELFYTETTTSLPSTEQWWGAGLYYRFVDSDQAQWNTWVTTPSPDNRTRRWLPAAHPPGRQARKERNLDFTLDRASLGTWQCVNNNADKTITIPNGIVRTDEPCAYFDVTRQGSGNVTFAVSGGAVLRTPAGRAFIAKQYQTVRVHLWVNASNNVEVFIGQIYPDADLSPTHASRNLDRNGSYTVAATQMGQLHRGTHGSVDIVVTMPYGLWPVTGEDIVSFQAVRTGNANVILRADTATGMTLRLPAGAAGVSQYDSGGGVMKDQFSLALWECRTVQIHKLDATTGEVFVEGAR